MWIVADVTFDTDTEAREALRLATEGKLAGVSVDLSDVTAEIEITAVDDEGFPTDWLETITNAEIIGATQVAMPAFADARIEIGPEGPIAFLAPEGMETSDRRLIEPGALTWREGAALMFNDSSDGHQGAVHVGNLSNFRRSLVASITVLDEWRTDPKLSTLTKPKVEKGRLVGHGAGWGTCHRAFANACITPPRSETNYAHAGELTIYKNPAGDVHAPLHLPLEAAKQWYDTHCEVVGKGMVGDDEPGIWVSAGTNLPDGDYFLSGDWRDVDGNLELINFLVVENPGFPTALVAAEHQQALTGAGIVTETDRVAMLEARIAELEMLREADRLLEMLNG